MILNRSHFVETVVRWSTCCVVVYWKLFSLTFFTAVFLKCKTCAHNILCSIGHCCVSDFVGLSVDVWISFTPDVVPFCGWLNLVQVIWCHLHLCFFSFFSCFFSVFLFYAHKLLSITANSCCVKELRSVPASCTPHSVLCERIMHHSSQSYTTYAVWPRCSQRTLWQLPSPMQLG